MKFTLPISPKYVAHWGLWEAVRELYQNALDEQDRRVSEAWLKWDGVLRVGNSGTKLAPSTLILGSSDKEGLRGKFGEGYKLAMLVLLRLGHTVRVRNGDETWTPRIEVDPAFGCEVLTVEVEPSDETSEIVEFLIDGVTAEQWADLQANVRPSPVASQILHDPAESGRIYVGGLYVTKLENFATGYSFRVGEITLDRDRGMAHSYDVSVATSRLWARVATAEEVYPLIERRAPDVEYVTHFAPKNAPVVDAVFLTYATRHGANTVPVTTQAEIAAVTRAGLKWTLVTDVMKSLLTKVRSWAIPHRRSPADRLRALLGKVSLDVRVELESIIASLEQQS